MKGRKCHHLTARLGTRLCLCLYVFVDAFNINEANVWRDACSLPLSLPLCLSPPSSFSLYNTSSGCLPLTHSRVSGDEQSPAVYPVFSAMCLSEIRGSHTHSHIHTHTGDASPLCQHSSSPPWRRFQFSCSPWHFATSGGKQERRKCSGGRGAPVRAETHLDRARVRGSVLLTVSSLSSHSTSDRSTLL